MPVLLCHFPIAKKQSKIQQKMIISEKNVFHHCYDLLPMGVQKNGHIHLPTSYFSYKHSMLELTK